MLFSIFNVFMLFVAAAGAFYGWRYLSSKHEHDASISAFIAVVTLSLFSAYVMVLGISATLSAFIDSVRAVVGFLTKP